MKNYLLVYIVIISFFSLRFGQAQTGEQNISGNYQQVSLANFIDSIRLKAGIGIAYDVRSIPVDSVFSIQFRAVTPKDLLTDVLKNSPVEIVGTNDQLIIRSNLVAEVSPFIRLTGLIQNDLSTPLPLVNICLEGRTLGTISNELGEFDFLIPRKFIGDTVLFSMLGYDMNRVYVPTQDSVVNLVLHESSVALPEVTVRYRKVDEIIDSFVKNKDQNYLDSTVVMNAFFRESVRQDGEYVDVSEAVLKVLKYSYKHNSNVERVKFVKGRKSADVEEIKDVDFRLAGGPYYFSRIDLARYLDFFPIEDEAELYEYQLEGVDFEYDRPVFVIQFKPVYDSGDLVYKGQLRIDTESFALISANFELTKNSLRKSRKYLIRKESRKIKAKPYYARYSLNYRPFKDRWILNKVRGEIRVQVEDRKEKAKVNFEAITEMVISDLLAEGGERFRASELYKEKYVLADEIKGFDPDFWKDYNIIKPNEELERVFKSQKGHPK
jgi:hypothetical protein